MKERTKGFISGILVSVAILCMIGTATASTATVKKSLEYNNIGVEVNGKKASLKDANGNSVEPFMINGTNYLPVRSVGEALGMDVSWDSKTKTVVMTGGSSDSKIRKMDFYHKLYVQFSGLNQIFMNFEYNVSMYQTQAAKNTLNAEVDSAIKKNITAMDTMYAGLLKDGLSTGEDAEIIGAFDRLGSIASNDLETIIASSSSSAISSIQYSAQNSLMDSLTYLSKSDNAFMAACYAI